MEYIMTIFTAVIILSFVVSVVIVKKRLFWVKYKIIGDEKPERISELKELATQLFMRRENSVQSEEGCGVVISKEDGKITEVVVKNKRVTVKYYDEEYVEKYIIIHTANSESRLILWYGLLIAAIGSAMICLSEAIIYFVDICNIYI